MSYTDIRNRRDLVKILREKVRELKARGYPSLAEAWRIAAEDTEPRTQEMYFSEANMAEGIIRTLHDCSVSVDARAVLIHLTFDRHPLRVLMTVDIARKLGKPVEWVEDAVKELEAAGLIRTWTEKDVPFYGSLKRCVECNGDHPVTRQESADDYKAGIEWTHEEYWKGPRYRWTVRRGFDASEAD